MTKDNLEELKNDNDIDNDDEVEFNNKIKNIIKD